MIPAKHLPSVAAFGPYTVDLRSGEIRKFGIRLKTGEQPFQILVLLLERRGQLVTRDEIRRRLWGNKTFVDFDHSLNSAVQRLRDCLSDSAGHARWIETVPRRGYRFVAAVEWREAYESPKPHRAALFEMPSSSEASQKKKAPLRRPWLTLVLFACLFATLALGYRALSASETGPLFANHSLAVLPLENVSGEPGEDSFVDELTNDLTTVLAKETSLRVISRTSVMRFKGTHRQIRDIARELGVDTIVEGSVARSGNELHVTTRLIDGHNDTHIWAETYERDVHETAMLLREIAQNISANANAPAHGKE